jgi:hypothetical protein
MPTGSSDAHDTKTTLPGVVIARETGTGKIPA